MNTLKELRNKLENEMKKCSQVFIIGHNGPDLDFFQVFWVIYYKIIILLIYYFLFFIDYISNH